MSQIEAGVSRLETKSVVAFGEVLWDCLESGLYLGGAPLNVSYHAAQLGSTSFVASSVGRDFLGDEAVRRIRSRGIRTELLSRHPTLLTGASVAKLNEAGDASYDILRPVAWDEIELSDSDLRLVAGADAFVYGSLAARSDVNADLLEEILKSSKAFKVCDVNLRAPFDDLEMALKLARYADVLKVNEEELVQLCGGTSGGLGEMIQALSQKTGVDLICVTRGKNGAALWRNMVMIEGKAGPVEVADTIGAGDSFTAALAMGLLEGRGDQQCLERALELSAFVASKSGAQPSYSSKDVFR